MLRILRSSETGRPSIPLPPDYAEHIPPSFDYIWQALEDPADIEAALQSTYDDNHDQLTRSFLAQLLTQIARARGMQDKLREAQAALDKAKWESSDKVAVIRMEVETARLRRVQGKDVEATTLLKKVYETAEGAPLDYFKADAAHILYLVEPDKGPKDAKTWEDAVLKIARDSVNVKTRRWAAVVLTDQGWKIFNEGRAIEALPLFEEALEIRKAAFTYSYNRHDGQPLLKTKQAYRVARWNLARVLREVGRYERAYKLQKELYDEGPTPKNEEELAILEKLRKQL